MKILALALVLRLLCFCHCEPLDLGKSPGNSRFGFNNNHGGRRKSHRVKVSIAVVLPHSMFKQREYKKIIMQAALQLDGSKFEEKFDLSPYLEMVQPIPAPTEVLGKICDQFLANNTAAILYLTDSENYGRDSVASQYFMQLAQYVKLPMISWNADNSAFQMGSLQLQLAPTLKQQASAMLSILDRYSWHTFSIVTGKIAGHHNFEIVIRDLISSVPADTSQEKSVIDTIVVKDPKTDLASLARTESRVFLLYCTRKEAIAIMSEAERLKLTGKSYVWIAAQAAIGSSLDGQDEFPVGMLGVHFPTDRNSMIGHIAPAMAVFGQALDELSQADEFDDAEKTAIVQSNVSCHGRGEVRWSHGETLFKYLKKVSVPKKEGGPPLQFNNDGSLKSAEIRIVNLQMDVEASKNAQTGIKKWEEIGTWQATPNTDESAEDGKQYPHGYIDIKDIVWPGHALKPPEGIPEKRFIRVSFLEEDPYIMLDPPSACSSNKGVLCQLKHDDQIVGVNMTQEAKNDDSEILKCCSGFCVDLLLKFASDLSFDFQMTRVRDGKWGGIANGKWNGLVAELINHETDIVMTSLKINSGRERVIDFSVPFLETGITILVAKKTGIISPTAFLEPFDTTSWAMVALVAIQVAAGCIFLFEWLSPSGYDMKGRFSFLRTLWLVWAVLFQAAVNVDCPRGYTARFMAHVWATFALIFLAIYTANLAAFMITREEFPNLSGLDDHRLSNPMSHKPPFRFGTIPNGATDYVLKNNFPNTHEYMKQFSRESVKKGFKAVKGDQLDAFVYDATVLEYLVGQDDECNVLTVGSWYAMTGYGVGFAKNSMWIPKFNEYLMRYRENGDLERMQRFWFTGACEPRKRRRTSSKPLALAQFMSAFLLLGIGITFSGLLLLCEHCYFRYLRKHLATTFRNTSWCNLISLDVGQSLDKARNDNQIEESRLSKNDQQQPPSAGSTCLDPLCNMSIKSVTRELKAATERIQSLQNQLAKINQNGQELKLRQASNQFRQQQVSEIETVL